MLRGLSIDCLFSHREVPQTFPIQQVIIPWWSLVKASDYSVMISGEVFKAHWTGVNSGKTFQTSHADFFPRLKLWMKQVSDPVKEWNIGNADALEGLKDEATTCTGMCCTFFPEPYVIQNSSMGSVLTTERARTITSVSLVLILMRRWPLNDASRAWIIRRVSASLWVHGARLLISDLLLEVSTLLPWVE